MGLLMRNGSRLLNPGIQRWAPPQRGFRNVADAVGTDDLQFLPLEHVRGPYVNFEGKRFHGMVIVPRPTDTGNYQAVSPANHYDLVYDFCTQGTSGAAWLQWIKPQIDAVKALGGTYIRWFWDCTVLAGDATHHGVATWRGTVTLAQFNTALDALITYLASQNMWFYATAMEAAQTDTAGSLTALPSGSNVGGLRVTESALLSYIDAYVGKVVQYPNVIACDVLMEFSRSDYAMTGTNLTKIMNRAKQARGSYSCPLTCSLWAATGTLSGYDPLMVQATNAGVDYFDFHPYITLGEPVFIEFLTANRWNLPIMIGETGITKNGNYFVSGAAQETVHPYSSELRKQHLQDNVGSYLNLHDLQVMTFYGVTDEWLTDDGQRWGAFTDAQDGSYNFTTQRSDAVTVFQTGVNDVQAYDLAHTLGLTGSDRIAVSSSTLGVGEGMYDATAAGEFTLTGNRLKRISNILGGPGLLDFFDRVSVDQRISVDFNASLGTPVSTIMTWSVGLRYQAGARNYYFVTITSFPGDGTNDGRLAIWSAPGSVLLANLITIQPFNATHTYRLVVTATGSWPTALSATLTDLTTSTVYGPLTVNDSTAQVQGAGALGFPQNIGTVYYENISLTSTGDPGPTLDAAPAIGTATATTLPLTWSAARGGTGTIRYIPQYAPLNSNGFPTSAWVSAPSTTGLSATLTGLTPGQRYAVRLQMLDQRAA